MKDRMICLRLSQEDYDQLEKNFAAEQAKVNPHKIRKTDYYRDKLLYEHSDRELRLVQYNLKKIQMQIRHMNLLLKNNKMNDEAFRKELESFFGEIKNLEELLKERK